MNTDIYLDSNATTIVLPVAVDATVRTLTEGFGNPSSAHTVGLRARRLMNDVRDRACRVLGVDQGRLMFNSGATEGIQTAVLSALCAVRDKRACGTPTGNLLLYGATEHKAVSESLAHWNRVLGLDLKVRSIPVGQDGRHDLAVLRCWVPDAALVCTMAANNETGAISDLEGIAAVLENSSALWLVDCVQALGKLPLHLASTRIDYAPFSGHKLYAPKGIGMLYVRAGTPFTPLMIGGGQEAGQRSGTENMAGIAALGAVLAELENGTTFRSREELEKLRGLLVDVLTESFPGIEFNTPLGQSLPTTLNVSVPGLSSGQLLDTFDAAGLCVSAGSACSAAKSLPSYVLHAMGLPDWRASNAVRISFGPATDEATILEACRRIRHCRDALRRAGMLEDAPEIRLDGVVRIGVDGEYAWLLADKDAGVAMVVDGGPTCKAQIDDILRRHRYSAVIEVSTSDAATWPEAGDCMRVGRWIVRRIAVGARGICCTVSREDVNPWVAFTGTLLPGDLPEGLPADTVLCGATSETTYVNVRALRQVAADVTTDMHLDVLGLRKLMREQPGTVLVDVRERYEHLAAAPTGLMECAVDVPSTQLANALRGWLAHPDRPSIVFVCRSGNRSERAARCLRSLSYGRAFHLAGGLAAAAPMSQADR